MNSLMSINRFQAPISLFNKLLIISLFFYIPFQFFFRYFNFDEYQNIFRLFILIFLAYLFLLSKNIMKIAVLSVLTFYILLNFIKLDNYCFIYSISGLISYSTLLIFCINKGCFVNIINKDTFIKTVSICSILLIAIIGSYASFYNLDVERFSYPEFTKDYPLTNPNTIALYLSLNMYFIFSLTRLGNKVLSSKDLIYLQTFSIICFYVLSLSLSRQACLVTNIILFIMFIETLLFQTNSRERLIFFLNFLISIMISIYVFHTRGNFIHQQIEGRYSSLISYSNNYSDFIFSNENLINKLDTLKVIFGKIFGASTNFVISFDKLFKLGGIRYIPSADNMFLSSLNNGGIFLTVIILFLFIKLIQPQRINFSTTIIMFSNYLILTILCFGHVFNENVVVFLLFCMTLFLKKFNISNIN